MSADIVERISVELVSANKIGDPDLASVLRDAANALADRDAEIGRLRGEVAPLPAWIIRWMAEREILPDDDGDGIDERALIEALDNHERELLNAIPKSIAPAEAKGDGDELKSIANDIALLRERGTPLSRELALIELRIRSAAEAANTPQPAGGEAVSFDAEAVAWAYRKLLDFGCYTSEAGAMMGDRLNLMLLADTTPPAPVQAAPQDGEATLPVVIYGTVYEVPVRVQLHIEHLRMKLEAIGRAAQHHPITDLLDATEHCLSAADEGVDYAVSRPMLDAMTTLGLMEKVGRGKWAPTHSARRFVTLAAAHPSACELGADSELGPLTLRRDKEGKLQLYRVGFNLRFATFSPGVLERERCAVFAALQHRGDSRGGEG